MGLVRLKFWCGRTFAVAVKVRSRRHFFQVIHFTPYRRSSSIEGCIPSKVVFRQRSSSVKSCLPSSLSSIKGCLLSKVVFYQRSSSIKGHLWSKVVFGQNRVRN